MIEFPKDLEEYEQYMHGKCLFGQEILLFYDGDEQKPYVAVVGHNRKVIPKDIDTRIFYHLSEDADNRGDSDIMQEYLTDFYFNPENHKIYGGYTDPEYGFVSITSYYSSYERKYYKSNRNGPQHHDNIWKRSELKIQCSGHFKIHPRYHTFTMPSEYLPDIILNNEGKTLYLRWNCKVNKQIKLFIDGIEVIYE
ncbi:hypothetical protein WA158_000533 [Blastocystis sp. Blastoise]